VAVLVTTALLCIIPTAEANAVPVPKAVVTLSPTTSQLGHTVTAAVSRSTVPRRDPLKRIRLSWGDGSKAITLANLSKHATHRYAVPGAYTVRLTLTDARNSVARGSAVEHVLTPAGSYTGFSPFAGLQFYVSANRKTVQDVSDPQFLHCSNGTGLNDELIVVSAAIRTDGSFAVSPTSSGILNGQPVKYAYHFAGRFRWSPAATATQVAGTMRETISFPDSGVTCTSNTEAWSGQRDTQPTQSNASPRAGSYTGFSPFAGLQFYVSASRKTVQDVAAPQFLHCSDGTGLNDELIVPAAPITASGSFAATRTSTGILNGQSAGYKSIFRGDFHSIGPNGALRGAGTMRETISFPDSGVTCTTNSEAWSGQRDTQPTQSNASPPTGGYAGFSPFAGLTFTAVSGTSIQNVSDPQFLHCSDGTGLNDELIVPSATIASDGSFTATATDSGTLGGHPTDFTYDFRGNFHGLGENGAERAAGTMRESLAFTDTGVTCTSNIEAWTGRRTG
jgi:hypothetical protein